MVFMNDIDLSLMLPPITCIYVTTMQRLPTIHVMNYDVLSNGSVFRLQTHMVLTYGSIFGKRDLLAIDVGFILELFSKYEMIS